MKPTPSHDEVSELLPEMALGMLDGSDLQRVLDHTARCPDCARSLREYEDVVAGLAHLTPERTLDATRSARLRERLLARTRENPRDGADVPVGIVPGPHPSRREGTAERWMGRMGWMVAAGLSGVLLVHHSIHRPVDHGWLVAGVIALALVAVGLYARALRVKVSALRDRLTLIEGEQPPRDPPRGR